MPAVDHYENFPVASWLCPPHLRGAVVAIYHFARTADDLADEGNDTPEQRLAQLAAYRQALDSAVAVQIHPIGATAPLAPRADVADDLPPAPDRSNTPRLWPQVFAPLAIQIQKNALPLNCLHALLDAFEQDVRYTQQGRRYASRAELLDYCAKSANPIGHGAGKI